MKEETKNVIIELSKVFDENEGHITCEIAIHRNNIPEMEKFVKKNTNLQFGRWIFTECETCVGYNKEGYVHASIERHDTIRKMKTSPYFIKVI